MTAVLVTYLIIVSFFSYFSQCFGNWKYVIEYVGAPFTISFTFFILETMKERHNKIKKAFLVNTKTMFQLAEVSC